MDDNQSLKRPPAFEPGQAIGPHFTVDRQLTTAPHRSYYLAHNGTPRWYTTACWNCGQLHNPPTAASCDYCQSPLTHRHFLMVARWDAEVGDYHAYASRRIKSQWINPPVVLYRFRGQLIAIHELAETEALLTEAAAPLAPRTVLTTAWSLLSAAIDLADNGVVLADLVPENVLFASDRARLFDPDIQEVQRGPVEAGSDADRALVRQVASLVEQYCPVGSPGLGDFFHQAAAGAWPDSRRFRDGLRRFARYYRHIPSPNRAVALTHVGRERSGNEDAWGWRCCGETEIFAVADGMGGYQRGEVASRTAVDAFLATAEDGFASNGQKARLAVIDRAIKAANDAVCELATPGIPVGTTLVTLVLFPDGTGRISVVGDSRAYRRRGSETLLLTEDQSMVGAMVASGKIDLETARTHPKSNVLLQFIGGADDVEPDHVDIRVEPGDQYLLCTDGLWSEMPAKVLDANWREQNESWRAVRRLVESANAEGGKDNITALVVTR